MHELIPPYYGRFAAEASALLVEHPGVVSHDISSFISMNLQVPIALMDPEFIDDSDLIFDQVVSIQPKEMSPDWNIRQENIAKKIEKAQKELIRQNVTNIPVAIQFALNPDHHGWLYELTQLWENPKVLDVHSHLKQCQVDLPLFLEVLGVSIEDGNIHEGMRVNGSTAAILLTIGRNAVKYAYPDSVPVARLTQTDNLCTLTIVNDSTNKHIGKGSYPHERPIKLGSRGMAQETGVEGTGIGARSAQILALLDIGAHYIMKETGITGEGRFGYETQIQFPSHALYQ